MDADTSPFNHLLDGLDINILKSSVLIYRTRCRNTRVLPLHLTLAAFYGTKIDNVANSLDDYATKSEAIALLHSLVTEVRLHPEEGA